MAIESANIPLPSEIILPFGGYLVSTGDLNFWGVAFAGTIGGTLGSMASYIIGFYGGRPLLDRYGRYLGISHANLAMADQWFTRYGEYTVFFTRLMPVIRTFISLPAGISKMNFNRFVIYTFLGSLPWCVFLTWLGFKLGEEWESIEKYFHLADVVIIGAVVLFIVVYFWRKKKR
ncbi:MAG TPA: DedA family protein [Clostridia bacterium]|nr:DedA family protein [Clostridia bacterium]